MKNGKPNNSIQKSLTFTNQININHQLDDMELYDNDGRKFFNQIIYFAFFFTSKYKDFYDVHFCGLIKKYEKVFEQKMYMINHNYIKVIKSTFHFNEIIDILKKNSGLESELKTINFKNFLILKKTLNRNTLVDFSKLNKDNIMQKFNNPIYLEKTSKHLNNDSSNNLFYFDNFQIINGMVFDMLTKVDKKILGKCVEIRGIFSDKKIILLIYENGNYVINIGITNNNDIFVVENLIQTESVHNNQSDLPKIFEIIKKYEYNKFIKKFVKNEKIEIKEKKNNINAKLYTITSGGNIFDINTDQNFYISQKLKGIILLAISQSIDIDIFHKFNDTKIEKVYLLNYNYFLNFEYNEIKTKLKNNKNIQSLIRDFNKPNFSSIMELFSAIISYLNKDEWLKIDKELENKDLSKENLEAECEYIKLKNNKDLKIYKEFIIVTEKFFNEIKNFLFSTKSQNTIQHVDYIYKDRDIIIINNKNQNSIIIGDLNAQDNLFQTKYILDFKKEPQLKEELNNIQTIGVEKYLNEKTVYRDKDIDDLYSPIFSENNELGNCYKYKSGINYLDFLKDDYYNYIKSENLNKIIKLYNFYNEMNEKRNKENNYYLIKKEIIVNIKKDFYYDKIIEKLKQAQFNLSDKNEHKKLLYIIKNIDDDIYENFIKGKKPVIKFEKYFWPDKISISIPDSSNESIQIYDNFEILDISIASEFINDISGNKSIKKDENYIKCSIKDGKIIISFTNNNNKDYKFIYLIGCLDNDNTFKREYLIIYKEDKSHFKQIQNNLLNYLNSIENQFNLGVHKPTNNKNEEIGKIINFKLLAPSNIKKVENIPEQQIINNNDNNLDKIQIDVDNIDKGENKQDNNKNEIDKLKKLKTKIIKEYNLDAKIQFIQIKDNFIMPPLIGLDNIGATCYMNATLQCLCNIPKFVNYFKYKKYLINFVIDDLIRGNKSLSSSFKLLIEQLWPDRLYHKPASYAAYGSIGNNNTFSNKKNESFAPEEFKKKISDMNELFKGVAANDAKDLVQFLIMTLHQELNMSTNQNIIHNVMKQDQKNQQFMFELFQKDFVNSNKSIISDLFYGVNYNVIQCQGCHVKSYNYQTYFFFVFPLEEVRIFKNNNNNMNNNFNNFNCNNFNPNMNIFNNINNVNPNLNIINNINNNNEIDIYDCFNYDQRINYMSGENAMYCNYCEKTCITAMWTYLAFGPEIIIIILNRGQGIQYKVKINFYEEIYLNNYIEYKQTGVHYKLIGVITHLGGSDMSGHFIAYCKNPLDERWYQYNDSVINEVHDFKSEVIDYAMPYLLFYQKVEVK